MLALNIREIICSHCSICTL